ncbi:MAG: right-handed parallel beta-helix repeat-containing protein, partial [Planctomycetota bacterium]
SQLSDRRQKRWGLFESLETRNLLATFSVSNLSDSCVGSFRQAILDANAATGNDEVVFDAGVVGTIELTSGEIVITEGLTITGPGRELLTLDAGENSRILNIAATTDTLELSGTKLTSGRSNGNGGAIYSEASLLTIRDSIISGNSTENAGGGIFSVGDVELVGSIVQGNEAYRGGGISAGYITVRNSEIRSNETYESGSGIFASSGARIEHSAINYNRGINRSLGRGGGIRSLGPVLISDSIIRGNGSGSGGGISGSGLIEINGSVVGQNSGYSSSGAVSGREVIVRNSSVSGNSADRYGGISGREVTIENSTVRFNTASYLAGAVAGTDSVEISNSTISGNSTLAFQAAAVRGSNSIRISSSTVTDNYGGGIWSNSSAETRIENSIIALNGDFDLSGQTPQSVVWSLIGDNVLSGLVESQTPDSNGNLIGSSSGSGVIDPMLDELASNGGPALPDGSVIRTHALLPGSQAIDMGDPNAVAGENGVAEFDQRGMPFDRVARGPGSVAPRIDIGAFEVQTEETDGDFNNDGNFDCHDVDDLISEIAQNRSDLSYDLNGDGDVTDADLDAWLAEAGSANLGAGRVYLRGDATLDGNVDVEDFNIWNRNKFLTVPTIPGWCEGNFNADFFVDVSDFAIWNQNKFTSSIAPLPIAGNHSDVFLNSGEFSESAETSYFTPALFVTNDAASTAEMKRRTPTSVVARNLARREAVDSREEAELVISVDAWTISFDVDGFDSRTFVLAKCLC